MTNNNTPCECGNWTRGIVPEKWHGRTSDGIPLVTNHHPNCPHYNDSLMDVWKVTDGHSTCYLDNAQDAQDAADEEKVTVTLEKMHREVFEHLPEFEGF